MDFELFLYSTYHAEFIARLLLEMVKNIVRKDLKMDLNEESDIYIACGSFALNVEREDVSDLEFIRENYRIEINLCVDNQVYNKTFDVGIAQMLKVVGALLRQIEGDAMLLSNGSSQVLRRDREGLFVNSDRQFSRYPYVELGMSYVERKLELDQ